MFRFSIRELLLLTVIFALAAGWWRERHPQQSQLVPVLAPIVHSGDPPLPTDKEIYNAWQRANQASPSRQIVNQEWGANTLRITKEKIAQYVDPPRKVSLLGTVELRHYHYLCTIHCQQANITEVVYVDHNGFRLLNESDSDAGQ